MSQRTPRIGCAALGCVSAPFLFFGVGSLCHWLFG